jgi:hypothetical protein
MASKTPTEQQYEDIVLATEIRTVYNRLSVEQCYDTSEGIDINLVLGLPFHHLLGSHIAKTNHKIKDVKA